VPQIVILNFIHSHLLSDLKKGESTMKRALVLAGGGARGAFQVGMLKELVANQGLDFTVIRGVSVGALNAAFLAQASTEGDSLANLQARVAEMTAIWTQEITGNDSVYDKRIGGLLGVAGGADSLYSLEPLKALLKEHLTIPTLQNSGRDFAVGLVSLVSGLYQSARPQDNFFMEKLLGSASIPLVFPFVPVKQIKEAFVDGGVRNITPLGEVFEAEPDEIYVLLTSRLIHDSDALPLSTAMVSNYENWHDNFLGTKVNGLDVLKRALDILTDEIYLEDIRTAIQWNDTVKSIEAVEQVAAVETQTSEVMKQAIDAVRASLNGKRYVPIYVIAPQEWFGTENSSTEFSPELIAQAIAHGQEIAADRTKWVWPFEK
jgi:NTE family protein